MQILFLGGDLRQKYASDYLNKRSIKSKSYINYTLNDDEVLKDIGESSVIVLPLPIQKDSIDEIFNRINAKQTVLGGIIPENIYTKYSNKCRAIIDYYKNDYFVLHNAFLSAEGAIFYAKEKINRSIKNSKIAILGFGRIGKMISYLLWAQGAKISVFTRKDIDCLWSELMGFDAHKTENLSAVADVKDNNSFDIIFNTIPAHIINEDLIKDIHNSIIIDLASYPYGLDDELLKKYNVSYYREPGIPGRYAPQSAGEIIGETVINILNQEKLL